MDKKILLALFDKILIDNYDDSSFMENEYNILKRIYGLLHREYIYTEEGLYKIRVKYIKGDFGNCPRFMCGNKKALPIGISEYENHSLVKLYCTNCEDIFHPYVNISGIDGAYFGTSYPFYFMYIFNDLSSKNNNENYKYKPKIFGFVIFGKEGSKFKGYNTHNYKSNYKQIIN